ncbi:MAG TPA: hypothetical protein VIS06_12045 [Mycobacteriales bacterium]
MTPAEELAALPLVEADRLAGDRIEAARSDMSTWARARAARIWVEVQSGRTQADVARELGIAPDTVTKRLRAAGYPTRRGQAQ